MPCRAGVDPDRRSSASIEACRAAAVGSCDSNTGAAKIRGSTSIHDSGAAKISNSSSVHNTGAAKIRIDPSSYRFARNWAIYIGVRREIPLPGRYDRMGQYPFEDLSLPYKPQIRPHEARCIYVRERNRSGRYKGCQEGEALVKSSAGRLSC